MRYIWSPWRMKYILQQDRSPGCVFCRAADKEDGVDNLIIARSQRTFLIMNRYPYTSGHVMVVPFAHQPSYEMLDPETRAEIMEMVTAITGVLRDLYHPEGINVGANIGAAAGAGIAAHVHFHVVPRWGGDTNFMSAVADTRVLPESLPVTYQRLVKGWKTR